MSGLVVIQHDGLGGARAVVAAESVPTWELRGWAAVGPAAAPGDPRTQAEARADAEALAARVAALSGQPQAAPQRRTSPATKSGKTAAKPAGGLTDGDN